MGTEQNRLALATMGLLLLIVAVYANSMRNGFHFDDFHTIVDNPAVHSLRNAPRFFTDATTFSVLPANRTYRPLVSLSLAVDYALGKYVSHAPAGAFAPLWFHLSTLLFFLLLVYLLSRLFQLFFNKVQPDPANAWLGLLAAAWFGLHPAMAETVNYIIQRGDLYCTLGCVASLFLYARYPGYRRYGLYLLPYVVALLSKPPAAVFPVLLLAYVTLFEPRKDRKGMHVLKVVVPSVVVTILLLALQSAMTPKSFHPSDISAAAYRWTQPYVWLRYAGLLLLPIHLNIDSDLKAFDAVSASAVAGLLFLTLLLAATVLCCRRQRLRPIGFGLLWFVVTQVPTSLYPLSEVENDHRMFFSFPGLTLAVVGAAWLLWQRFPTIAADRRLRAATATLLLCSLAGYAYGVHVRNQVWSTEETLWRDDVEKSPENGRGLMIYGLARMERGDYPAALELFTRAQHFTPNYPTLEINLGVVNGAMADQGRGNPSSAELHFRRALALAPQDDLPHAYYGRWLSDHGRMEEAIDQLNTAVRLNPSRLMARDEVIQAYAREGNTDAAHRAAIETLALVPDDAKARQALTQPPPDAEFWINLSLRQYQQGSFAAAEGSARRALALSPDHRDAAAAWNNLGAAQGARHQYDEAIHSEREAVRLDPQLQVAQNNLQSFAEKKAGAGKSSTDLLNDSLYLNQQGKYKESLQAARQALRLDPHMAEAWNNIAADHESMRQWDNAIAAAKRAIALKPGFQLAKNNLAWSLGQKRLQGEKPR